MSSSRPVRAPANPWPSAARGESDPVAHLVRALDKAIARLQPLTDVEPVVQQLRAAGDGVRAAAGAIGTSRPRPGLHAWRHDLRAHVAAMAGWALILGQKRDEATRLRATEAVERNAKALGDLLAHPPAAPPAPTA